MQEGLSVEKTVSVVPLWYENAIIGLSEVDLTQLLTNLEKLGLAELTEFFGGSIEELSYELLRIILPSGSDDEEVATILREKRKMYLKSHPNEILASKARRGVIAYDGRFMPEAEWKALPLNERLAVTVGPTCSHYAGHVPGYGD